MSCPECDGAGRLEAAAIRKAKGMSLLEERNALRARVAKLEAEKRKLIAGGCRLQCWIEEGCGESGFRCADGWEDAIEQWEEAKGD